MLYCVCVGGWVGGGGGWVGVVGVRGAEMPNIGICNMPPKIVGILVLGTPKHLELGLILQN